MKTLLFASLVLSASLVSACAKPEAPAPAAQPEAKVRPRLVLGYDAIREGLAIDSLEVTREAAKELLTQDGLPEGMKLPLEAFRTAPDLEAARLVFGDLSKAYLTHIAATPALQNEGLIAFRCPMAKGYQRWVELKEPMRNPYMGKVMLDCGAKVGLTPE